MKYQYKILSKVSSLFFILPKQINIKKYFVFVLLLTFIASPVFARVLIRGKSRFYSSTTGNSAGGATYSSPSFAQQNTTATNDMAADGYNFAQAKPIMIDQYGKIILWAERYNSNSSRHVIVVSNDSGSTWTEPTRTGFYDASGEGFLTRASCAYDSVNDLLHCLWSATASTDGIIYRRYSFTRDGSNNITGVTRVAGINLQLDFEVTGTMQYEEPSMIWLSNGGANGEILAVWSARNTGTGSGTNKNEIRASMRVLSNTAADNTAGNWAAPVTADTTGIGNAPSVAYSIITQNNFGGITYSSILRKSSNTNSGDIYVAFYNGDSSGTPKYQFRRMRWNSGSSNWSTGLSSIVDLSNMVISGADTGYSLKNQLISQLSEDTTNDRVYVGFPVWKSNVLGDTQSFVYIDSADTVSSRVDIYSASGAHTYAPTLDAWYDNTSRRLIYSYIKNDKFAYIQTYNGTTLDQSETTLFNSVGVDIPLIYPGRVNSKLFFLFRDTVNTPTPPYHGYAGTMNIADVASSRITRIKFR